MHPTLLHLFLSMNVGNESMTAEIIANPNKKILVENFRFTKTEGILFTLDVDGGHFYDLLYKSIYERPYATLANESTAILEVVGTEILRCFEKRSIRTLSG